MAVGRGFGGKEFSVRIGRRDQSATAVGTAVSTDAHTLSPVVYRLNGLNDIAWDAGYQRTELDRTGTRVKRAEDIINHYGSGSWTWDFDWTCDNEVGIQNLLDLLYPSNANGAASSSGFIVPASPTVVSYAHGVQGSLDCTADIVIDNPVTNESRLMHGAILQNLTLSMDHTTEGGVMKATGQFYTGYKPVLQNCDSIVTNSESTASDFQKGLFDFTTHTVGGDDSSVKAFSVTMSNPATRVGFQGSSGEADGYVRAGNFDITGSITIKADENAMEHIDAWQSNSTFAIALNDGSTFDFALPACNMSGHNLDLANDGVFLEIPFTATSGADGGSNPITIKMT
tara:strand:- start:33660 stop:34685 length:1026 start_codon:yes stop_codon:yes gene_type:complete